MERLCPEFKEEMERLYGENGKRRCAWIEFLAAQGYNACITLQTNQRKMEFFRLRSLVGQWLKRTDCALIGRQHRKYPERRITGWFHCEKLDEKPHAHGYFKVVPRLISRHGSIAMLKMKMEIAWEKVIASGDTKLDVQTNPFGTVRYQSKEFRQRNFWENVIDAEEFWPCINQRAAQKSANKLTRH